MRNLILFISKYSYFFLFLLFEVFAFYILFLNNNFQGASFLNSTNAITGGLYSKYSEWTDYLNLKEVNQALAEENNRLQGRQLSSYTPLFENEIVLNDSILQLKYVFLNTKVVNNSTHRQNNYLTLNTGSLNGVKAGMGVIGPNGVIGVVKNVSEHYAAVLSLLHRSAKISVKLQSSDYFGSLQWDGGNYRFGKVEDIPKHVQLNIGDTIVTSGYSATFPEGIATAVIEEFTPIQGDNFYDIKVKFLTDFKNLSQLYVVKNIYRTEQEALENLTEEAHD